MNNIREEQKNKKRNRMMMLIMFAGMCLAVIFSLCVGYYPLSPPQLFKAFASRFGYEGDVLPEAVTIFWNIRLPRILAGVMIGASLSVAGSVYQGIFRNPLVSPDILAVASGASLGAALAILGASPAWLIQLSAFIGGIAAVSLTYFIARKSALAQTLGLILTGIMVTALCNAGVTMIKYIANPNDVLQQLTFWLMGSLTKVNMSSLGWSVIPMVAGLLAILALRWRINLLTLDDEEAMSLGVNVKRYRLILIVASTLISSAAVCLGGLIGWVGLMIPHICRAIVGPDYKRLVPACAMVGAAYLVLIDDLARSLISLELPLGVVTSVMGAPFFVFLVIRRKDRQM
ncbi:MAG: iron ABC transporter permease [Oscillospiraceae bacterium]|nr:iron ABC transporter permease [Oscillospiraceae bacterium]